MGSPSQTPTHFPSLGPVTLMPTSNPEASITHNPTHQPSSGSTLMPTSSPEASITHNPTHQPSSGSTLMPTSSPEASTTTTTTTMTTTAATTATTTSSAVFAGSGVFYMDWDISKCVRECIGERPCRSRRKQNWEAGHATVEQCCATASYMKFSDCSYMPVMITTSGGGGRGGR